MSSVGKAYIDCRIEASMPDVDPAIIRRITRLFIVEAAHALVAERRLSLPGLCTLSVGVVGHKSTNLGCEVNTDQVRIYTRKSPQLARALRSTILNERDLSWRNTGSTKASTRTGLKKRRRKAVQNAAVR